MNGKDLKNLRIKHAVTQLEMAIALKVTPSCINGYERADTVSIARLNQYADVLNDSKLKSILSELKNFNNKNEIK